MGCFHAAVERPSSLSAITYDSAFFPRAIHLLILDDYVFSFLFSLCTTARSSPKDWAILRAQLGSERGWTVRADRLESVAQASIREHSWQFFLVSGLFIQSSYLSILASVARSLARLAGLTQKPKIPKKLPKNSSIPLQ
jgi:hypothetical protein